MATMRRQRPERRRLTPRITRQKTERRAIALARYRSRKTIDMAMAVLA
jgi:hypothetical protein